MPPIPTHVTTWSVPTPGGTGAGGPPVTYGDVHEIMYRDIAMGNDYRKERIKHMATMATGVFALTATFHKDLVGQSPDKPELFLLLVGWLLLVLSLLAGIEHLRRWENFYLGFRDSANALWRWRVAAPAGKAAEEDNWTKAGVRVKECMKGYKTWDNVQTGTLVAGLVLIVFAIAASVLG